MTKQTVITCPKCQGALHSVTITGTDSVFDESTMDHVQVHYIQLTCAKCASQLQFVVDLQPQFESSASALAPTT